MDGKQARARLDEIRRQKDGQVEAIEELGKAAAKAYEPRVLKLIEEAVEDDEVQIVYELTSMSYDGHSYLIAVGKELCKLFSAKHYSCEWRTVAVHDVEVKLEVTIQW